MKGLLAIALTALVALPLFAAEAFDGTASHYMSSASDMVPPSAVTVTMWVMNTGDGADATDDGFFALTDASSTTNWMVGKNTAGPFFRIIGTGLSNFSSVSTVTDNVWYFLAFSRPTTNRFLYINGNTGTADITSTGTSTATEPGTRFAIGGRRTASGTDGSRCVCRIAALKVWNEALTTTEMLNEMYHYRPQRTANIWLWIPLFEYNATQIDMTGQDNDLSVATGTPTTASGPPIPW